MQSRPSPRNCSFSLAFGYVLCGSARFDRQEEGDNGHPLGEVTIVSEQCSVRERYTGSKREARAFTDSSEM